MTTRIESTIATLFAALACAAVLPAAAHGDAHSGHKSGPVVKEQKDWGIAGDAKAARRTISVTMHDTMRFDPARIEVRQGETVRFVVRNAGQAMHEFVIGTRQELQAHAEMMKKHPTMEHDEPYMAHVAPGKTGEIVWTFNRPGEFWFGCLVAGHYDAGMVGRLIVAAAR